MLGVLHPVEQHLDRSRLVTSWFSIDRDKDRLVERVGQQCRQFLFCGGRRGLPDCLLLRRLGWPGPAL